MTAPVTASATVNAASAKQLDQMLGALEPKLTRRVLRSALRQAGNVVRDEARMRAPVESGLLRRRIAVRVGYDRKLGAMSAQVGIFAASRRKNKRKAAEAPYYARWVELGHRIVPRRRSKKEGFTQVVMTRTADGGLRPTRQRITQKRARAIAASKGGRVAPRPFLVPALTARQGDVQRVLIDAIRAGLDAITRGSA